MEKSGNKNSKIDFTASIEVYKTLYDNAADAILILDNDVFIECNKVSEKLFGRKRDEIIGATPYDLSPKHQLNGEDSKERALHLITDSLAGNINRFEWIHTRGNGEIFYVEVNLNHVDLPDGTFLIAIVRDITENKVLLDKIKEQNERIATFSTEIVAKNDELNTLNSRLLDEILEKQEAQELLIESEERLKNFIDQSLDGILIISEDGKIVLNNNSTLRIIEDENANITGKLLWEFLYELEPEHRKKAEKKAQIKNEVLKYFTHDNQESVYSEQEIFTKEGHLKYLHIATFPIRIGKKKYIGRIARDITKQKTAEQDILNYKDQLEEVVNERTKEYISSEGKFKKIFHQSPGFVLITDLNTGRILDANYLFLEKMDFKIQQLRSKYLNELGIQKESLQKIEQQLSENERYTNVDLQLVAPNGAKFYCIASGELIRLNKEDVVLNIITDNTERKQLVEKILQSERNYKEIFNTTSDAIFIRDIEENKLIDVNDAFLELTGFSKEEALMLDPDKMGIVEEPEFNTDKAKYWIDSLQEKGYQQFEWKSQNKQGAIIYMEVILKFITIDDKSRILGVLRDITSRKKAEKAFVENERKYRLLFESANDAIFLIKETVFVDCNQKALDLFECTYDELINKTPFDFSPKYQPDGKTSKEKVEEIMKTKINSYLEPFEWVHLSKKGREFYAEVSLTDFNLNDQEFSLAIMRDLSYRKKIEEKIRISEENFRNIYTNTEDAIVLSSFDGQLIDTNPGFYKILGYSKSETKKLNLNQLVIPDSKLMVQQKMREAIKKKKQAYLEVDFIRKDKKIITAEIKSKIIDYNNDKVLLTIGSDITERKELEKRLFDTIIETEEKERARIAGDLHDEIGPILSSLKMYASLLSTTSDEDKREYINTQINDIVKEAIVNVREISNALSPHILNNYGLSAALNVVIEQAKDFLEVDYNIDFEDIRFLTNIEIVYYRIIKELLNNTIKHSGAERVKIELTYDGEAIRLLFRDNGKGFDMNEVLQNQKKGIGLFNILNRIKTINGRYSVGKGEGHGFEFKLYTKAKTIDKS